MQVLHSLESFSSFQDIVKGLLHNVNSHATNVLRGEFFPIEISQVKVEQTFVGYAEFVADFHHFRHVDIPVTITEVYKLTQMFCAKPENR